jgi:hypothetical protein
MALSDNAVIIPGRGYAFINDTVGAPAPADTPAEVAALDLEADTLATGWRNLGHTSRDNNVSLGRDGGETEVKGSWQNAALRTTKSAVIWAISIAALQIDNDVLRLYFGGGDATQPDSFGLPDAPVSQEVGLYVVMVDGATRLPLHFPKVDIGGSDAIEVDPENFLEFALTATVLKATGQDLGRIYRAGLGDPA